MLVAQKPRCPVWFEFLLTNLCPFGKISAGRHGKSITTEKNVEQRVEDEGEEQRGADDDDDEEELEQRGEDEGEAQRGADDDEEELYTRKQNKKSGWGGAPVTSLHTPQKVGSCTPGPSSQTRQPVSLLSTQGKIGNHLSSKGKSVRPTLTCTHF